MNGRRSRGYAPCNRAAAPRGAIAPRSRPLSGDLLSKLKFVLLPLALTLPGDALRIYAPSVEHVSITGHYEPAP